MDSLHHAALVSFLAFYPGIVLEGDVLQIVTEQVVRALNKSWRVFCLGDGRYAHFTSFVAKLANGVAFHPKKMCDELDLPDEAVTELVRCGRSRMNGWVLQSDGLIKHSTVDAQHTPTSASELYDFLTSPSLSLIHI